MPAASRGASQNQPPVLNTTFRAALGVKVCFFSRDGSMQGAPLWSPVEPDVLLVWIHTLTPHVFSLQILSYSGASPHLSSHPLVLLSKTFSPSTIENTSIAIQSPSHHWGGGGGGGSIGALCLKRISLDWCKTLKLPQLFITPPVNFPFTHHLQKNVSTNELHQPVVLQERERSNFPLDICAGGPSNATWSTFPWRSLNQLYMSLS